MPATASGLSGKGSDVMEASNQDLVSARREIVALQQIPEARRLARSEERRMIDAATATDPHARETAQVIRHGPTGAARHLEADVPVAR